MYLQGSLNLLQQWERWRGRNVVPARHDIKPLDVKTLLRDMFILDIDADAHVNFRLAGTRLCSAFGRELRSTAFATLWQRIDQPVMLNKLGRVITDREADALDVVGVTGTGREVAYEIAFFPLLREGETHHVLGLATPKALPYWFASELLLGFRSLSARTPKPDFLDVRERVSRGRLPPMHINARQVGHLTVYDGGKS
ncbi:PAS domain-containing protein [Limoniibacter endophyticus]|uniref:PAS domain-containing protein n=1 Tax=Limoniibacter endophyticus TaxID=1565040 RepID=A0A8J3DFW2_9HYPH|nr:PAS domain-containing protein [Limoniibacter endophyticus]GHC62633.1 PAS domain-containing protein [Limoniibacter endophyticus]